MQTVKSQKNSTHAFWNYANHFTYTAAGAVASMQLGNGTWEKIAFNSRLQPTQIGLGKVQNTTDLLQSRLHLRRRRKRHAQYGEEQRHIQSQTITVPAKQPESARFSIKATYGLHRNRLQSAPKRPPADTSAWKQTYAFDR
ncbi:MAG: hypothetical protein IPK58_19140 [Acidobacteria bacterium]|nr:hypothetical protein [Acidobacteriota bacterium]